MKTLSWCVATSCSDGINILYALASATRPAASCLMLCVISRLHIAWCTAVLGAGFLQLRMQVEQLCRDKASLAAEVSQLKRDKEGLQELLQYAQQFDSGEEELLGDEIDLEDETGGAGTSAAEDEATQLWLEELRKTQMKDPGNANGTLDA